MNPLNDFQLRNFLDSVYNRRENMIVNGDLLIDQINLGAVAAVTAAFSPVCDNFKAGLTTAAAAVTSQRGVSTLPGYGVDFNLILINTVTAAPAAGDQNFCFTVIEGYTLSRLGWGTPLARPLCFGFWAFSSVVGEYGFAIQNSSANRSYQSTFTILQANTWEFKIISIPGDTTGTWVTGAIGSAYILWDLGCGTNLETTTVNQWKNTLSLRTPTCVKFINTGGTVRLGGIRALPDYVDQFPTCKRYDDALRECQRFYRPSNIDVPKGAFIGSVVGQAVTTSALALTYNHAPMRIVPTTIEVWNNGVQNQYRPTGGGAVVAGGAPTFPGLNSQGLSIIQLPAPVFALGALYDFDLIETASLV